jgi:hypothetical protein
MNVYCGRCGAVQDYKFVGTIHRNCGGSYQLRAPTPPDPLQAVSERKIKIGLEHTCGCSVKAPCIIARTMFEAINSHIRRGLLSDARIVRYRLLLHLEGTWTGAPRQKRA